jgi:predicted N-formylglutamate amidohydrolase
VRANQHGKPSLVLGRHSETPVVEESNRPEDVVHVLHSMIVRCVTRSVEPAIGEAGPAVESEDEA